MNNTVPAHANARRYTGNRYMPAYAPAYTHSAHTYRRPQAHVTHAQLRAHVRYLVATGQLSAQLVAQLGGAR